MFCDPKGLLFVANRHAHDSTGGLPALRFVSNRFTLGQIGSLDKQGRCKNLAPLVKPPDYGRFLI